MTDQSPPGAGLLELVEPPASGRLTTGVGGRVRLGDVAQSGRLRFDAIARILQDASTDDSQAALVDGGADATEARGHAWVVRRMRIEVALPIRYRQQYATTTWCSGIGGRWAERRTDISIDGQAAVRSAALWVNIDVVTGRPAPIPSYFARVYGEAANGRGASQRLHLPTLPDAATATALGVTTATWPLRATDFDVLGHVNNAAYLHALESHEISEVARAVELEWRGGINPGDSVALVTSDTRAAGARVITMWLVVDAEVRATIRATAAVAI